MMFLDAHRSPDLTPLFAPYNASLALLERTLTPSRRKMADALLKQTEAALAHGIAGQPTLIQGDQGAGKSHVLAYVVGTLRERHDVDSLTVIALYDEIRGIASLFDFLMACLRATGQFGSGELLERIEEFGPDRVAAATDVLGEVTHGTSIVLVVESFADLANGLPKGDAAALRKFLEETPRLTVFASSDRDLAGGGKAKHPFRGFFEVRVLEPLGSAEVRGVLNRHLESSGFAPAETSLAHFETEGPVQTVTHLTRGNHRLVNATKQFLEDGTLRGLRGCFEEMANVLLTPYFQQRLDRLSDQQYKIFMAILSGSGRPIPVKDIARITFLSSQTVSRQLYDLLHGGYVDRTQLGRESFYEIHDPLVRLVIQFNEGHPSALTNTVDFLLLWHRCRALNATLPEDDPPDTVALEATIDRLSETIAAPGPEDDPVRLAQAYVDLAAIQGELGRNHDALETCDSFLGRMAKHDTDEVRIHMAQALINKAADFAALQRYGKALATLEEIVDRFASAEDSRFSEFVLRAHLHSAECRLRRGEDIEALAALNRALEIHPSDPAVLAQRIEILLESREDADAFKSLSDMLLNENATWPEQVVLVENLIILFSDRERLLSRIGIVYADHREYLLGGLILWAQSQLASSMDGAKGTEPVEDTVRAAFADFPEAEQVWDVLRAARHHARGEPRALLELPVELRELIRGPKMDEPANK